MKPIKQIIGYGAAISLGAFAALEYIYDTPTLTLLGIPTIEMPSIEDWIAPAIWVFLFILVISPGVLAYAHDKDGKIASGWAIIFSVGLSVALFAIYMVALSIWMAWS